ncbi:HAD family phosphatase [Escherichia fergusonii]|uniref:Cof-type HAD-IIB family hydrolase n=1 Tax=Escherichia fergusonii TaxID=564 RepID=UPI0015E96D05|nr:Cof-type HAD-IIB family hydrolase [Escherichia fergusonii]EGO8188198.1 HAD family phosphatase [Escherichia fergusonii]MBV7580262.1 Cof-type HAD-IIB family hydrolase [Escherichia fergusonii]MCO7825611.1 Cof-type HAD-IIB family hydrolase [Escherichia fergusonii]MCO7834860.1 Cof-type HAD-IIB family hydrolase [Escherichia fergusonii]MCO7914670.1 Cof-type HAD-IIB family hydrolase [Escherichia fergusonii]
MICQLIALDLDGTLLNSKKMISPASISALQSAQQTGVKIILATGRSHSEALPYYQQLQLTGPMICCNGSYLYHPRQQQILRPLALDIHKVEQLRLWFSQQILQPHIYTYDDFVLQISLIHRKTSLLRQTEEFARQELSLNCSWSWHHQLDITQAGCDKGKSLLWYAQQQNIALDEIIVFGDNDNDAGMLQMVGKGIAMGNGSFLAKASSNCVIGHNNTDAIADFLDAQGFR